MNRYQYKNNPGVPLSFDDLRHAFPLVTFHSDGPDQDWMDSVGIEIYQEPFLPPTVQQISAQLEAGLDAYFEQKVAEHNAVVGTSFANRHSLIERSGYSGPYQAQAQAFGTWMDTCNAHAQTVKTDCLAGTRPIPTLEDLIAELPVLVWP